MAKRSQTGAVRKPRAVRARARAAEPRWRHENFPRLLISIFAHIERALVEAARRAGFPEVRVAHMRLLRELDMPGTRASVLAERLGVTKQAIGEMLDDCEALGFVGRYPDPTDGRAKIVRFQAHGLKLLEAGHAAIDRVQRELGSVIGNARMSAVGTLIQAGATR